jgi:hypothetical protein
MSMFKIDELAGTLVKSGRFKDAIPVLGKELQMAIEHRVITNQEYFGPRGIMARFCEMLLNPNSADAAQKLGDDLICIAIRIPNYVKKAGEVTSSYRGSDYR